MSSSVDTHLLVLLSVVVPRRLFLAIFCEEDDFACDSLFRGLLFEIEAKSEENNSLFPHEQDNASYF